MNYSMPGTQSSHGATGRGDQLFDHEDFHKERLLPSLCSKVHFVHLQKTGSKLSIPFRLFFLTIDSTFFTHWKTLAFTLSADDQLVSLIGGAFQHFLRFHWDVLCPSKTVLSIRNGKSDLRIPESPEVGLKKISGGSGVANFLSRLVFGLLMDRFRCKF